MLIDLLRFVVVLIEMQDIKNDATVHIVGVRQISRVMIMFSGIESDVQILIEVSALFKFSDYDADYAT